MGLMRIAANAEHTAAYAMAPPGGVVKDAAEAWAQWEAVASACVAATPGLKEAIHGFWNTPIRLKFFSASRKNLYFWRLDDFYVSQLMLDTADGQEASQYMAQLRVSDGACSALLSHVLGPASPAQKQSSSEFRFSRITRFEAALLQEFSREIFGALVKTLVKKRVSTKKPPDLVHLIWLIQPEDSPEAPEPGFFKEQAGVGKIILTLPMQALRLHEELTATPKPAEALDDALFLHAHTLGSLSVGTTRLPLADLQQLEPGDLVVLERSRADRLFLVEPLSGEELPFTAQFANRQKLEVPYTQEIAIMEQQHAADARQNLWDNLLIDVKAEFEPVKLQLKQLKQMTEGLVVEIGDLTHNHIRLQVEGRSLAWGELVIVGDKFGVRVVDVEADQPQEDPGEEKRYSAPIPQEQAPVAGDDYSQHDSNEGLPEANPEDDFLNDDFNEEDFNEEEW